MRQNNFTITYENDKKKKNRKRREESEVEDPNDAKIRNEKINNLNQVFLGSVDGEG